MILAEADEIRESAPCLFTVRHQRSVGNSSVGRVCISPRADRETCRRASAQNAHPLAARSPCAKMQNRSPPRTFYPAGGLRDDADSPGCAVQQISEKARERSGQTDGPDVAVSGALLRVGQIARQHYAHVHWDLLSTSVNLNPKMTHLINCEIPQLSSPSSILSELRASSP